MRVKERCVVGRDVEVLVGDDDERGPVHKWVVRRLGEDGSVGLDGRARVVGRKSERRVGDIELAEPSNEELLLKEKRRWSAGGFEESCRRSVIPRLTGVSVPLTITSAPTAAVWL